MSLFGLRKKKETTTELEEEIDNKAVEAYLEAFMHHNRLNSEKALVTDISSKKDGDQYLITIKAGFPGVLIGPQGSIAKKLSSGLSKYLRRTVKLDITY